MTAQEIVKDSNSENKDAQTIPSSPGEILAIARESRGLSRAYMASELGLGENAIRDIEIDAFERFPAGIYCRGYLRNYCKVLEIPDAGVLKAFDDFCIDRGENGTSDIPACNLKLGPVKKTNRSGLWLFCAGLIVIAATLSWLFFI